MSNLDTFAKVRALHDRTTNPGEKAAAANRMKALAKKAGMTVAEAVSMLDAPKQAPPRNLFEEIFNSPEFRARDAERQRERAERRAAALAEYGSPEAVFADSEREAALRRACAPLTVWDERPEYRGCYTLAGWDAFSDKRTMPAAVREAVAEGWPCPETVTAAWAEFQAAEALANARYAFEPDYSPHPWVDARGYVLEEALDTMPARSLNDLRARMSWLEHLSKLQVQWTHDDDLIRFATLRADIERMGARLREQDAASVQNGQGAEPCNSRSGSALPVQNGQKQGCSHPVSPSPRSADGADCISERDLVDHASFGRAVRRTNADKRRDVLELLGSAGDLTDREIARRAGVSPTTVGTIRRARAARPASP